MGRTPLIQQLEEPFLKKNIPSFRVGDTVCVETRIMEGEKERIQAFTGVVIARKGYGLSETFTVYRNAYGSNMERIFLVHSPRISSISVQRSGKVRRAKLYYLRNRTGKAAKVREQFSPNGMKAAPAMAATATE